MKYAGQGDFDYAGAVDFNDFQIVLSNFGATDAALSSSELATLDNFAAQFGDEVNVERAGFSITSVPEPASAAFLAARPAALLVRRRRKRIESNSDN